MPRILLDLYKTKNLNSGLGQFSLQYSKYLAAMAPGDFELHALVSKKSDTSIDERYHFQFHNPINRYLESKKKFDLWHNLYQFSAQIPNSKSKNILTIHDLNFLIEKKGSKQKKYLHLLQKEIDRADAITTISNFTKNQILKHLKVDGKRLTTIYNGVEIQQKPIEQRPHFAEGNDFLFSIGIFSEKKRFLSLLDFMLDNEKYNLIIAGNNQTKYGQSMRMEIEKKKLQNRVILPGMVSDTEKNWLYQNCLAFVFPSEAEGFGMPVIEAMMHGKPVFISNETSLPEIGGSLAYYFKNLESKTISDTIEMGMSEFNSDSKKHSDNLIEYSQKFSWNTSIKSYLQVYQEVLNKA